MKKLFIDGNWVDTGKTIEVKSPFDGTVVDTICEASIADTMKAIDAAYKAKNIMKKLTAAERGKILDNMSALYPQRSGGDSPDNHR